MDCIGDVFLASDVAFHHRRIPIPVSFPFPILRPTHFYKQHDVDGNKLGLMMNSRKLLNGAWADVVKRARKVAPPIDEEMTATRAEISAAVRGASAPIPAERPPNLGAMSTQEYRRYLATLGIHNF